jgi:hypothetical protein
MLFDTILSRVQKIRFCPPTSAEIENYLKEKKLGEKERKEILEICGRKPGLVIDLAVNPQKLKQRREKIRELTEIAKSDLALRFQYARTMSENPRDVKEILDIWLSYFRKIFLEQCSIPDVKKMERIRDTIKSTQNTIFLLSSTNVNPRLALENLMLEI